MYDSIFKQDITIKLEISCCKAVANESLSEEMIRSLNSNGVLYGSLYSSELNCNVVVCDFTNKKTNNVLKYEYCLKQSLRELATIENKYLQ